MPMRKKRRGSGALGPLGEPLGAIRLGGPSVRVPRQSLRGLGLKLKELAESISERLG